MILTRNQNHRRFRGTLLLAVAAIGLSACGSQSSSLDTPATSGGAEHISVGVQPVVAILPLYAGIDQGFFEDENLQVEPVSGQTGPALVTQTLNGQLDMAFVGSPVLVNAVASNIPLRYVTATNVTDENDGAESQIITTADSGINSPGDLTGKRVAVNSLESLLQTAARYAVDEAGGDGAAVDYVEVPFQSMLATLKRGEVDAIVTAEPFATTALESGGKSIQNLWEALPSGIPVAAIATSEKLASTNPDVVERFQHAWEKSVQYVQDHEKEARQYLLEYTNMDTELVEKINLSSYSADLEANKAVDGLEFLAKLGGTYGYYKEQPDVSKLVQP